MSWDACAYVRKISSNITRTEKLLLTYLAERHNPDHNFSWPSVSKLATECLVTERRAFQILASLEKKKLIKRVESGNGRGHMTAYQIGGLDFEIKDEILEVTTCERMKSDDEKGCNLVSGKDEISRHTIIKEKEESKEERGAANLNLQMPFCRWAEMAFRAKGIKWVKPKFPDSFEKLEQEPARKDLVAYLGDGGDNLMQWYHPYKERGGVWKTTTKRTNGNGNHLPPADIGGYQPAPYDDNPGITQRDIELMDKWEREDKEREQRIRERKEARLAAGYRD